MRSIFSRFNLSKEASYPPLAVVPKITTNASMHEPLTDGQRFAAEMVIASIIFDKIAVDAQKQRGELREYYLTRLQEIETKDLQGKKADVFEKARRWTPSEQRSILRSSINAIRKQRGKNNNALIVWYLKHVAKLPKDNIDRLDNELHKARVTWVKTVTINIAMQVIPLATGFAVEKSGALIKKVDSLEALLVIGSSTYLMMIMLLTANGFENNKLLKEKGISTVALSKWAYEKFQNARSMAAIIGYIGYHAAMEVPFAVSALTIVSEKGVKQGAIFFAAANMAAIGSQGLLYSATLLYGKYSGKPSELFEHEK